MRDGAWCPIAANQRWSLDFTHDALGNGRAFRTANLKDDCTRECPAIVAALSLPGSRVVKMLERVARERGYPDVLTVDNDPELRGRALPHTHNPNNNRSGHLIWHINRSTQFVLDRDNCYMAKIPISHQLHFLACPNSAIQGLNQDLDSREL